MDEWMVGCSVGVGSVINVCGVRVVVEGGTVWFRMLRQEKSNWMAGLLVYVN